jgi:hypothetical protein
VLSDWTRLSVRVLPNLEFKFKIEIKFKGLDWIQDETESIKSKI